MLSPALTRWTDLDTVLLFPDPVEFILLPPSLYRLLFWSAARPKLHANIHTHKHKGTVERREQREGRERGDTKLSTCSISYLLIAKDEMQVSSPGFSFIVTRLEMVGCREKQRIELAHIWILANNASHVTNAYFHSFKKEKATISQLWKKNLNILS